MRKKIIINTANLQKGGALQVAISFVEEASKCTTIDFIIVLGRASSVVIDQKLFDSIPHLKFETVNIHPTDSIIAGLKFKKILHIIEKRSKANGVITVFGPCYWKPSVPHILGFANGYLLYQDTYFFEVWKGWRSWKYQLKKKIHQHLLKREASLYWTETEDSKQRLSKFIGVKGERIVVASNNCSHYFRDKPYHVFPKLPPKKAIRLLYISSYYPHKGFEFIPAVLTRLKELKLDVEMVITIKTEDHNRLFASFDNVINLQSVNPKYCPYLYEQSDIVFAPTLLETFSAIYPEAMFMGRPIVTTDLPFARSICGDAALYFEPGSVNSAVEQLMFLMDTNKSNKEHLIAKGKQHLSYFDLPTKRFEKVLNRIINP